MSPDHGVRVGQRVMVLREDRNQEQLPKQGQTVSNANLVCNKTCRDRSMGAGLSSQPTAALEPSSKLPQESSKQLSERFASKGFGGVAISVELRSGRETGCQAGRFRWHQIQGRTAALLLSQRCQESYIFKSYLKSSVEQPCRAGRMSALQMIGFEERGCRRRGFKYLLCALGTRPVMLLQARSPIQALEQRRNLSSWEK